MPREVDRYEIDEAGFVRNAVSDGRAPRLGRIVTERGQVSHLAPFVAAERDLVRVALAVLNVDRRCHRELLGLREEARDASRLRSLDVTIPVEDPTRWRSAEPTLATLLRFMTDDRWIFKFIQATYPPAEQLPLFAEPVPVTTEVVLFSGGLDSVGRRLGQAPYAGTPEHRAYRCQRQREARISADGRREAP